MQVHIQESFNRSYDAAYAEYAADWEVRPAIVYLKRYIMDATYRTNDNHSLDDMSDDTVAAACQSYGWILDKFNGRDPTAPDRKTASFLKGICKSIPLTTGPSTNKPDNDSRIYVWQPPSRKYRKFARAVGVYLHHPSNARVLLHVWIGAHYDLEDCLNEFKRVNFSWSNLWSHYGQWLIEVP